MTTTTTVFNTSLGGTPEQFSCDVQVIQSTGVAEVAIPYADLVPALETRPLCIKSSFIRSYGNNTDMSGMHMIFVESPAGSGHWKTPIGWQLDGNQIAQNDFSQGVYMSPGDELCFDTQGTVLKGFSAGVNYTIGI